jgi:hypothetical protein
MVGSSLYVRRDAESIVIGNRWLERRVLARQGAPTRTVAFVNHQSGRDYARGESKEFSFAANERHLTARDFVFVGASIREGDPVEIALDLMTRDGALAAQIHFQMHSRYPVVRKWLLIENRGAAAIRLAELAWEDLHLRVDASASAEVWSDYFTRRAKNVVVTMDDCALLVNDVRHHEGFIVATEAPGPLKYLEAYADGARIAVGYNRDDETIFERVLAPGESFATAASFLLAFANEIPQDVIDGAYAQFVAEQLTVCDVARVPTITVNTWEPHLFAIHRALLLEQIDVAADLGADAYQVDAGWYDRMGDWNADAQKFPNGLEEIADAVRARNMRFGLWVAAATVDEASDVCRAHPEWIARAEDGTPNRHPLPGVVTMCLDSAYYDFILAKLDDIIRRYGVELLKLDLSAVRNVYAPGKYPGCLATNHAHRSPRESHLRILERLFDLIRTLKRRHPQCLVDLTYELYGVMDGTDLALIQVADQNWFTNIASPNEVSLRREIFQRGRVTRPWTLNFGGTHLDHPNALRYGLVSTLTAHAVVWGDLAKLDAATRAQYRRWFAWAKRQRAVGDFYRHYQVSDVFPVPDGISARDYRHAIPTARYGIAPRGIHPPAFEPQSRALGEFWDGVARLDARGEGPIFLFRPAASREEIFQLRIPWVQADARYRIQDAMQETEMGIFAGSDLITRGIAIRIAEPLSARVIVLTRM